MKDNFLPRYFFIDNGGGKSWDLFAGMEITRTIVRKKTPFQEISILESPVYGKMLVLDGVLQSTVADEAIYHEFLVHPALVLHSQPENVLILGGGEGATLREVLKNPLVKKAVLVDIDKEVVYLTQRYLSEMWQKCYQDKRAQIKINEATQFLKKTSQKFDLILSDLTDPLTDSASIVFSPSYFQLLKKRLADQGLLVIQAGEFSHIEYEAYLRLFYLAKKFFPNVFPYKVFVPSFIYEQAFLLISPNKNFFVELSPDKIDSLIKEKIQGKLKHYCGETHQAAFSLSPVLRRILKKRPRK